MPETNFDKNTTDHGMNMGIRSVSKEYKDVSKNNKTGNIGKYQEGVLVNTENLSRFNFPHSFIPQYNREKKTKDYFNIIQRTSSTFICFNTLSD